MSNSLESTTMNLLNCAVCRSQLTNPITLSCGYTICSTCFPHQQMSTFICPVKRCNQGKHLFGPTLSTDQVLEKFIEHNYLYTDLMFFKENYDTVSTLLQCPLGDHPLQHPITTHCGHTFCKLCLLQHRMTHDSCTVCHKRLPGYAFTQKHPINILLSIILPAYYQLPKQQEYQLANPTTKVNISFSDFKNTQYENIPIYLTDFPVLPSQKLRVPFYLQQQPERISSFFQALIPCKEYQSLCLAVLKRNPAGYHNNGPLIGTMVKISNVEQRATDIIVDIVGLDRFQVTNIHQDTDDFIAADIDMKFENQQDINNNNNKSVHWVDAANDKQQLVSSLPPSPSSSSMSGIMMTPTSIPPSSPPAEFFADDRSTIKIAKQIYNFIHDLAHSTTSFNFCSTVEGLLGPVWLQSVQNLHGPLPMAEHPVALCWWSAIVLPVSNIERMQLLHIESLEERLSTVLSWLNDLHTQKGNGRKAAMSPVAHINN